MNIRPAIRQTVANKGSAGVDKMPVFSLKDYFDDHQSRLFNKIISHQYLPRAIRGVKIPKPNGKTRLLGVPTVIDRVLQQSVSQVLMQKFEMYFHPNSYGFQPEKNAQHPSTRRRAELESPSTFRYWDMALRAALRRGAKENTS